MRKGGHKSEQKSGRPDRTGRAAPSSGPRDAPARLPANAVALGEFGRAHGLRGEVRLKSFTGDPLAIADYDPLFDDRGKPLRITALRPAPGPAHDMLIASIAGVTDRTPAEALNRRQIYTTRAAISATSESEDEYLLADLIGMSVETTSGEALGRIVAVPDFGAGDLLEIEPLSRGPTALLPFTKAFVPTVDIAGRRVVVDAPDDLFAPASPEPDHPEEPDEPEESGR
ncbi:MAG TPA: ribosome maturation factor RimM [Saliniramus sp.]|nr:ribosome maturation factor RimM [Saliniramus sp.]